MGAVTASSPQGIELKKEYKEIENADNFGNMKF